MNASAILNLIQEMNRLKSLPRTGWVIRGITDCESVADHCFGMSYLAMLLADVLVEQGIELDTEKVMRLAMVHEMGEARITDLPWPAMRHIPPEAKKIAEGSAVDDMMRAFGTLGQRYIDLWKEFEAGDTLEAQLVKAVDKLEMMIQVSQYEWVGYRSLDEFWENPMNFKFFDVFPLIEELIDLLTERRKEMRNGG
jgi:putative hydrolase of HD superfamily